MSIANWKQLQNRIKEDYEKCFNEWKTYSPEKLIDMAGSIFLSQRIYEEIQDMQEESIYSTNWLMKYESPLEILHDDLEGISVSAINADEIKRSLFELSCNQNPDIDEFYPSYEEDREEMEP